MPPQHRTLQLTPTFLRPCPALRVLPPRAEHISPPLPHTNIPRDFDTGLAQFQMVLLVTLQTREWAPSPLLAVASTTFTELITTYNACNDWIPALISRTLLRS